MNSKINIIMLTLRIMSLTKSSMILTKFASTIMHSKMILSVQLKMQVISIKYFKNLPNKLSLSENTSIENFNNIDVSDIQSYIPLWQLMPKFSRLHENDKRKKRQKLREIANFIRLNDPLKK